MRLMCRLCRQVSEIWKNFKKPLDNPQHLCYNKYVIKRGTLLLSIKMGGDLSADERRKL